jgi:hypothetical protein
MLYLKSRVGSLLDAQSMKLKYYPLLSRLSADRSELVEVSLDGLPGFI